MRTNPNSTLPSPSSEAQKFPLLELPTELIAMIISQLGIESLSQCALACTNLSPIALKFLNTKTKNLLFGYREWEQHLGTVLKTPIPKYILTILDSPCPFSKKTQTISQTHVLIKVPKHIDGQVYTANRLGELVFTKNLGRFQYRRLHLRFNLPKIVQAKYGNIKVRKPYWILIYKGFVKKITVPDYRKPKYLEALTYNFARHFMKTGYRCKNYTECKEGYRDVKIHVGGFKEGKMDIRFESKKSKNRLISPVRIFPNPSSQKI